jgi:hypothetical protein
LPINRNTEDYLNREITSYKSKRTSYHIQPGFSILLAVFPCQSPQSMVLVYTFQHDFINTNSLFKILCVSFITVLSNTAWGHVLAGAGFVGNRATRLIAIHSHTSLEKKKSLSFPFRCFKENTSNAPFPIYK